MKRAFLIFATTLTLFGSLNSRAADFSFEVSTPKFRISLPGLPAMKMDVHPMHGSQPHLQFLGSEGPYTVSVITPTAAAGMTALECAASTVRSLAKRRGVPESAQMYKARLNANTFLAIYVSPLDGVVRLNAHVLSAAGGTHCIEVHASMVSVSDDELAPWIDGFDKANIESR